ncbi:condensation domain-containing protein [Streptomyces sp. SCA3-4]|uniref:condensation domain-containing protein n=1 Tax=Streptomyces sichuanensis TaxID=2871810 RepID=UPI001CE2DD8A|nr:condensation domain-containing protein [Streptomyces sichuanensis]MCA6092172.1 condensation domain-containing protein [Streptomyces sichuanensis]
MRLTTIDRYLPEPGRVVEFVPSAAALAVAEGAAASAVPPSFNQRFHLAGSTGNWLGCAFDLHGTVDVEALRAALERWVRRHGTLCSGFRAGGERFLVPAERTELVARDAGESGGPEELRAWLAGRLAAACGRLGWPSYLFLVVLRPGGGTVFCGFDHAHVDAYSLAIAVHELRESYAGRPLPAGVGSFVDHCAREQALAAGPPPAASDPRVRGWAAFFAACGGTTPSFPAALGEPAAQDTDVRRLLDAAGADALEAHCRAAGGGAFAGLLTAFGLAGRSLGAGEELRLCVPLHTRDEERWERAVGWFTTVAPMTVDVTGVTTAVDGAGRVRSAFREARRIASVPVARLLGTLERNGEFRRVGDDVFMVSYVDYRRLPGAADHIACRAHHVSGVTVADDAQFWLARTHEGLFLRSRHPGTAVARAVVGEFTDAVTAVVREAADGRRAGSRRGAARRR